MNPDIAGVPEVFSVDNCLAINELIRRLAEEWGLGLIDVYGLFADEDGILPRESTGDGIHLTMECYRTWGHWLASAVVPMEESSASEEAPAEEETAEAGETGGEEGPPPAETEPEENG